MCGLWLYLRFVPGSENDRRIAEGVFVAFLILLFTNVGAPAQYVALAAGVPFADSWLAATDAWLGIDLPAMVAWTHAHPLALAVLPLAYHSFGPQLLLTALALDFLGERERKSRVSTTAA
jgi:hypothetical protein